MKVRLLALLTIGLGPFGCASAPEEPARPAPPAHAARRASHEGIAVGTEHGVVTVHAALGRAPHQDYRCARGAAYASPAEPGVPGHGLVVCVSENDACLPEDRGTAQVHVWVRGPESFVRTWYEGSADDLDVEVVRDAAGAATAVRVSGEITLRHRAHPASFTMDDRLVVRVSGEAPLFG
ncbi:MAG TPA: hypothetical protein VIL20_26600 [Sandaracinaceae bacterium]